MCADVFLADGSPDPCAVRIQLAACDRGLGADRFERELRVRRDLAQVR